MSQNNRKSKIISVITIVIVLLLLVAAIGAIVHFAGGGTVNPLALKFEYGGEVYTGEDNEIVLPEEGQAVFTVKGADGYTAQIVPNADFEYTVGGKAYSFGSETEYTAMFVTSTDNETFVIDCEPLRYKPENVLSRLWGGAEIDIADELTESYYFKLVITSSDGRTVSALLAQGGPVTGITLEPDSIVF